MGNQSFLGKWDVSKGVKLQWSEGNEWSVTSQVPVGVDVSFKVSRKGELLACILWRGGGEGSNQLIRPVQPEAELSGSNDTPFGWERGCQPGGGNVWSKEANMM